MERFHIKCWVGQWLMIQGVMGWCLAGYGPQVIWVGGDLLANLSEFLGGRTWLVDMTHCKQPARTLCFVQPLSSQKGQSVNVVRCNMTHCKQPACTLCFVQPPSGPECECGQMQPHLKASKSFDPCLSALQHQLWCLGDCFGQYQYNKYYMQHCNYFAKLCTQFF